MSANLPPALQIEQVSSVRPGPDGRDRTLLDRLSFEVGRGRISVIVGPSGGGKSSLVRLLNRLEDPQSGRILLNGVDIASLDPLLLRRRVGLVLQKPVMFAGSVLDNLQQSFRLRRDSCSEADANLLQNTLHLCGLSAELLQQQARTLSIGQQQRVNLARTLIGGPEVLVLDEPTSALDRPTGDRLAVTLQEICRSRGMTLLMVTHDLRLAERIADHLGYLESGRILEQGPASRLLQQPQSPELQRFLAEPPSSAAEGSARG